MEMLTFRSFHWGFLVLALGICAGCGSTAPPSKGAQDAAQLRQHCQKNPTADPENCAIYLGGP
jgi:hypothetical protein